MRTGPNPAKARQGEANGHYAHGHCNGRISPTYSTWGSMIQRCINPKRKHFDHYGGRGIKVCDRWMKFENFLADMGERPDGLTLDRIDNDGNYEPGNCRWATNAEQSANRRKAVRIWKPPDLSGHRFGMLVVKTHAPTTPGQPHRWLCVCDCGNEVARRATFLIDGTSTHCGCGPMWIARSYAALKADADRYRWLRTRWEGSLHLQTVTVDGPDADDLEWGDGRIGECLDTAIDAAMKVRHD
jgi:hypothetical protein